MEGRAQAGLWTRLRTRPQGPEREGKEGRSGVRCTSVGRMERRPVEAQHSRPCDFSVWRSLLSLIPLQFISLTRPLDSHLEHVDFSSLLRCLRFEQILQIFASAVLERRIIFLAEGLRWVQPLSSSPGLTGTPGFRGQAGGLSQGIRL